MVTKIKETLRLLGITHSRPGFRRVVCAIELVLEDEDRLEAVTKEVYEVAAARIGGNWKTTERNIRSAVNTAWEHNRELLDEMAAYPLPSPPKASEFLEIVSNYIQRTETKPDTKKDFYSIGKR